MYAAVLIELDEDAIPTDVTSQVANLPGVTQAQIAVAGDGDSLGDEAKRAADLLTAAVPVEAGEQQTMSDPSDKSPADVLPAEG